MNNPIPSELMTTMKEFARELTEIEKLVIELTKMTPDQRDNLSFLERARRDITMASAVNILYCMHSATLGRDSGKEEAVGSEARRIKEVEDRLESLERRPTRPILNKKIAKAFVRNALYETTSPVSSFNFTDTRCETTAGLNDTQLMELVADDSAWNAEVNDELQRENYDDDEIQEDEDELQDNF